jgi:hypothetical protein
MNDDWRHADVDANHAKAEAIQHAIDTLRGLDGALDSIETPLIRNTIAVLERARDRHETAAKLRAVA